MDTKAIIHDLANKRQVVLWGLEPDADEADRIKAKRAFDEETEILNDLAKHIADIEQKLYGTEPVNFQRANTIDVVGEAGNEQIRKAI